MKSTQKQTISTGKYFQPEAMVNAAWVAEVYQNGWGVAQDYSKAHKWFKKAADDGNTAAMINLGRLYEQGLGVAQDFGKALEWFQKAGRRREQGCHGVERLETTGRTSFLAGRIPRAQEESVIP